MKCLMIAAPASGSGKTVLMCGLLAALSRRGLSLEAFKCGPDYIDPMYHRQVLGVPSHALDLFLQGEAGVKRTLAGQRADLALIEAAMGYYDGVNGTDEASAWRIAGIAEAPVVLAVRPEASSVTLAAEIAGMLCFRDPSRIVGVILTDCSSSRADLLAPIIERECALPVLGYLPSMEEAQFASRHLGLLTPAEIEDHAARFAAVADQLELTVDLDALLDLAGDVADPVTSKETTSELSPNAEACCTIAVARDEAFCFYYEDSLDALRSAGAELVFFSPLHDEALPASDGLYLGGGYPELYAEGLAANTAMREQVCAAVRAGLPTVAECGGYLYLQHELDDPDGRPWPMAGAFDEESTGYATSALRRFGYLTLGSDQDTLLVHGGEQIPAHEFHHWDVTADGADLIATKPNGMQWRCGHATPVLYAAFPHLHLAGEYPLAQRFADAAAQWRQAHPESQTAQPAIWQTASEPQAGCVSDEASDSEPTYSLEEVCVHIAPACEEVRAAARKRWDSLAKPLGSLGLLEDAVTRIAALCGNVGVSLDRRVLLVMCADNGVVAQGVAQSDASVTAAVATALGAGTSTANYMADEVDCAVVPVDVGMRDFAGAPGVLERRIRNATGDITCGPAMSRADCLRAIEVGIDLVHDETERGTSIILTGEMGIGNTTTTGVVASVLLGCDPDTCIGRGSGLSDEGLVRKRAAARLALEVNAPDPDDPIDILAKVGGLDLAALTGVCLGGALYRVPVLLDGVVATTAALCAVRICPTAIDALIASHRAANPAASRILEALGLEPLISAGMHLGEGSGALAALALLDEAVAVYESGHTFEDLGIEAYTPQTEHDECTGCNSDRSDPASPIRRSSCSA